MNVNPEEFKRLEREAFDGPMRRDARGRLIRPRGRRMTKQELSQLSADHVLYLCTKSFRHKPIERADSVVYFIQAESGGPIKIGYTSDIRTRVSSLSASSPTPLRVLATVPGGAAVERSLHLRFRRLRQHGEWFTPDADLIAYIEGIGR